MDKKYYTVRNRYLADGLAFLGFRYMKFGTGADTKYSFIDTEEFRNALTQMIQLKNVFDNVRKI